MIVYNKTQKPIMIIYSWSPDIFGGPSHIETHSMILPGQGIDLKIVGLLPKKSKKKLKKKKKH